MQAYFLFAFCIIKKLYIETYYLNSKGEIDNVLMKIRQSTNFGKEILENVENPILRNPLNISQMDANKYLFVMKTIPKKNNIHIIDVWNRHAITNAIRNLTYFLLNK